MHTPARIIGHPPKTFLVEQKNMVLIFWGVCKQSWGICDSPLDLVGVSYTCKLRGRDLALFVFLIWVIIK